MTRLLTWRTADRRDRPALQAFTCTVPTQRSPYRPTWHPRRWELEVQSFIRSLRPPLSPDQSLLVGEDTEGVASVCLLAQQADLQLIKIQVLAVAVRHRGKGGTYSDEAMDVALETAVERGRKTGLDAVTVIGLVHDRNRAAQRLNERAGFACQGTTPEGLEIWALTLDTEES